MPSRPEAPAVKLSAGCDVELIIAHMAASVGQPKATAVISVTLTKLGLPEKGPLSASDADRLLHSVSTEPGLVGLAGKVTHQMLRMGVSPLKPAF